jgi:hypothetical protein
MKVQDTNQGVALDHDGLVIRLRVNGEERPLVVEPRTTLLDALRDGLGLTASSPSPGRVLECRCPTCRAEFRVGVRRPP